MLTYNSLIPISQLYATFTPDDNLWNTLLTRHLRRIGPARRLGLVTLLLQHSHGFDEAASGPGASFF